MKKTFSVVACVLACSLMDSAALGQSLPDEINHAPYYNEYLEIKGERDGTESSLNGQRERLESTLSAIQEQRNYISTLEGQILDFAKRIGYLERILPQKESDKRDAEYELRSTESTIASLSSDLRRAQRDLESEQRVLRPIQRELRQLAREIKRQQDRIERLRRDARGHRRDVKSLEDSIANLRAANQNLKQRIKTLQGKESGLKTRISNLKGKITSAQSEVKSINQDIQKTSRRVKSLQGRLTKEKQELQRLRNSGASAQEISKQQRKVSTAQAALRSSKGELRGLQGKKRTAANKVKRLQGQLAKTERELASLPAQIKTARASIRSNRSKIQNNRSKLAQSENALAAVVKQIQDMERNIANIHRRHQRFQRQEDQIQRRINGIAGQMRRLENDLNSQESRAAGLRNRISMLRDEIQNIRQEIPTLERNIAYNRGEISNSQANIANLQAEEGETRDMIARLESELATLNARTATAYNEYEQRKDLYDNYLSKARQLGADQTNPALELGNSKGLELADLISTRLGQAFGADEGSAQAELIGSVRGELEAYPLGYDQGVNSSDSIEEGRAKGEAKGKEAVYAFVRTNLKPGYFENHMQELLKMPVGGNNKKRNMSFAPEIAEMAFDSAQVPDLQDSELASSRDIQTPLDAKIERALGETKKLQKRFSDYQKPNLAYNEPTTIPYTGVDCQAVYKGVVDYVQACQASFKRVFKNKYLAKTHEAFSASYTGQFVEKYQAAESSQREAQYGAAFENGYDVAFIQGEADGKQDAYDQAYKVAYDSSYAANMEPAKNTANLEAQREGNQWIAVNPILTVESSFISKKNLRGASKAALVVDLKNIASVNSLASGTLRIKTSKNVKFSQQTYKLADVAAKSIKQISIPFQVNADARSREQIKIVADLELPGDKYKAVREETVTLTDTLVVNPKYGTDFNYDQTPKVKGLFSYYIHKMSVTIKPVVEDLDDNYSVVLSVADSQEAIVDFKVDKLETGVLGKGQEQQLDFSYVFTTGARGKTVKMKLDVFFKGAKLDSQMIELYPH